MTIDEAIAILGCGPLPPPHGTLAAVRARLEQWKSDVMEPAHKAAIRRAHPDVPGGSVELAKAINNARDVLRGIEVTPPAPPPPHEVIVVIMPSSSSTTTSWSTVTGWTRWGR